MEEKKNEKIRRFWIKGEDAHEVAKKKERKKSDDLGFKIRRRCT